MTTLIPPNVEDNLMFGKFFSVCLSRIKTRVLVLTSMIALTLVRFALPPVPAASAAAPGASPAAAPAAVSPLQWQRSVQPNARKRKGNTLYFVRVLLLSGVRVEQSTRHWVAEVRERVPRCVRLLPFHVAPPYSSDLSTRSVRPAAPEDGAACSKVDHSLRRTKKYLAASVGDATAEGAPPSLIVITPRLLPPLPLAAVLICPRTRSYRL